MSFRNVILIANPVSGNFSKAKIKHAETYLKNQDCNVEVMLTKQKADAELFAREIASSSTHANPLVIACGGDGTYNEVANGLAYSDTVMGILPFGTTSVLAKQFDLPDDLTAVLSKTLNATPKHIHLGKLITANTTRYFILMTGIGFDADVVLNTTARLKAVLGKTAYFINILKALSRKSNTSFELHIEDSSQVIGCCTAVIGKSTYYGGRFVLTPDVSPFDPYFSVFALKECDFSSLLKVCKSMLLRQLPKGIHLKASKLTVKGTAGIQIDGDYVGQIPAEISIAQNALKIAV